MRFYTAVFTLVLMVLAISGCDSKGDKGEPAPPAEEKTPAPLQPGEINVEEIDIKAQAPKPDPNATVVSIGDYVITEADLSVAMKPALESMGRQVPQEYLGQYVSRLRQETVEQMVVMHLFEKQIEARKIVVPDEEVESNIQEQLKVENISMDDLRGLLSSYGITLSQYKERMQQKFALQKLIDEETAGKINIEPNDVRKFYDDNIDVFNLAEQVRASHIFLGTIAAAPGADPNTAKAKAEKLLEEIRSGGDFEQIAAENSDAGAGGANGSDTGYFTRGKYPKEFEDVAFALDVNEVGDILQTPYGYHIVKVTDKKPARMQTFDEVKTDIAAELVAMQKNTFANEYLVNLKAKAKIVYSNDADKLPPPPANIPQP